jgi:dual specificity phosphatase 12
MGWLDEVPRAGGLYIGGLHALYQKQDLFRAARITHIVSVMDYEIYGADGEKFPDYRSLQLRVEDDPNENLLDRFPATNAFIHEALRDGAGGRVFVHCAMGKSRSATVVCAYLMWKFGRSPEQALRQLCEGRPVCSPNPGFLEQLDVYHHMLQCGDDSAGAKVVYDTWLKERFRGSAWEWEKRRAEKVLAAAKL